MKTLIYLSFVLLLISSVTSICVDDSTCDANEVCALLKPIPKNASTALNSTIQQSDDVAACISEYLCGFTQENVKQTQTYYVQCNLASMLSAASLVLVHLFA